MSASDTAINLSRLVRWGWTTIASFLPFLFTLSAVSLTAQLDFEILTRRPQLLFAALVLGACALYDIISFDHVASDIWLQTVGGLTLLLVVFSGLLYGYHFAILNINHPDEVPVPLYFEASMCLMGGSVLSTIILQYKIAQSESSSHA